MNAAGAPGPSRVQTALTASERAHQAELAKEAPLVTGHQVTARILRSAVETIKFAKPNAKRQVPGEDESDRFDQADQEERATGTLGKQLDVTA